MKFLNFYLSELIYVEQFDKRKNEKNLCFFFNKFYTVCSKIDVAN